MSAIRRNGGLREAGPGALAEVLVSQGELAARVAELGEQLSDDLASTSQPPILVGVLKGSTLFLADRPMHRP
jgi:hypoxanthine-guanine phosphoribosyltransferase